MGAELWWCMIHGSEKGKVVDVERDIWKWEVLELS